MNNSYADVTTRFLRKDERLILSEEEEMPLVIEAKSATDTQFLQEFLRSNSAQILDDIAKYGAVLLRGFDVNSDESFEKTVLSIQGLQGISDAFMSEEGRVHVDNLKYVLHTNSVYKTGGTLYLGGFHSENYYSPDVPAYICFFCRKPSSLGGETGLINMEKIYQILDENLKNKLRKNSYFVSKWLISDVAERYQISPEIIAEICKHFDLPIMNAGLDKFILMYKPNIFENLQTKRRSLQINFFEIPTLNAELRKFFIKDYPGKTWFWHRFVWRLPDPVLKIIEFFYIIFASFFSSPKNAVNILKSKWKTNRASRLLPSFNTEKVGSCFNFHDTKNLARLMRNYYSSCIWKSGDVLLVDNRKVIHSGMPGAGPRLIRAMICNPLEMKYSAKESGFFVCKERETETIGSFMTSGKMPPSE
ncbi:MAG: TauD/TfdA family dioxygenase [Tatlockia sp.]|nr:TauD/TfdA family dioxygenase [Tatlockia sp.]